MNQMKQGMELIDIVCKIKEQFEKVYDIRRDTIYILEQFKKKVKHDENRRKMLDTVYESGVSHMVVSSWDDSVTYCRIDKIEVTETGQVKIFARQNMSGEYITLFLSDLSNSELDRLIHYFFNKL